MAAFLSNVKPTRMKVTMDVYSGRENPSWDIPVEAARELIERISKIAERSNVRPPGSVGGLGYRGFSIESLESGISWFIREGIVDLGLATSLLISGSSEIERWLLGLAGGLLSAAVTYHVADKLKQATVALAGGTSAKGCPPCSAVDAPTLNLARWNTPTAQPDNNCYNYANDQMTNTFAQPGRASGRPRTGFTCPGVQPSAVSDGLTATSLNRTLAAGQGFYVALVIWPGQDYHWYRQDTNGCWSHKPGETPARNTDDSGASISDPRTCDRGPYTDFCSFMITNSTVRIS